MWTGLQEVGRKFSTPTEAFNGILWNFKIKNGRYRYLTNSTHSAYMVWNSGTCKDKANIISWENITTYDTLKLAECEICHKGKALLYSPSGITYKLLCNDCILWRRWHWRNMRTQDEIVSMFEATKKQLDEIEEAPRTGDSLHEVKRLMLSSQLSILSWMLSDTKNEKWYIQAVKTL